jgi:hypothetical protein
MDPLRAAIRRIAEDTARDPEKCCPRCGKVKPEHAVQLAVGPVRHVRAGRYRAQAFETTETCSCSRDSHD